MRILSQAHFKLRGNLLTAAETHVPEVGFTYAALSRALDTLPNRIDVSDALLAQMFDRGFPSALVQHVVQRSNMVAQQHLENKYSANAVIDAISKNHENFAMGRYKLPKGRDVAEDALLAKVAYLRSLVEQWPTAVAIEYQPSNVPFTMIGLAEFIDTTAYYMERVDSLHDLMEPARRILNARLMSSYIPSQNDAAASRDGAAIEDRSPVTQFLRSFIQGVPLSSGPHLGESSFSVGWYTRRAKLGVAYGLTITSLLGDDSRDALETRAFVKNAADTLF